MEAKHWDLKLLCPAPVAFLEEFYLLFGERTFPNLLCMHTARCTWLGQKRYPQPLFESFTIQSYFIQRLSWSTITNSSNSLVSVQCLRRSWTHLSRPNSDQIAGIPSSSSLSSPYSDHYWPGTNGPHSSAVLASSARFHLAGRWWMARGRWPPGSSIYDMISLRSSHKWIRSVTAKILIRNFEKVLKTGLTGLTPDWADWDRDQTF